MGNWSRYYHTRLRSPRPHRSYGKPKTDRFTDVDDYGVPNPYYKEQSINTRDWQQYQKGYRGDQLTSEKDKNYAWSRFQKAEWDNDIIAEHFGGSPGRKLDPEDYYKSVEELSWKLTKDFERLGLNTNLDATEFSEAIEGLFGAAEAEGVDLGYSRYEKQLAQELQTSSFLPTLVSKRRSAGKQLHDMFESLSPEQQAYHRKRELEYRTYVSELSGRSVQPEVRPDLNNLAYYLEPGTKMDKDGKPTNLKTWLQQNVTGEIYPLRPKQWYLDQLEHIRKLEERESIKQGINAVVPLQGVHKDTYGTPSDPIQQPRRKQASGISQLQNQIKFYETNSEGMLVHEDGVAVLRSPEQVDEDLKRATSEIIMRLQNVDMPEEEKARMIKYFMTSASGDGLLNAISGILGRFIEPFTPEGGYSSFSYLKPGLSFGDPEIFKMYAAELNRLKSLAAEHRDLYSKAKTNGLGQKVYDLSEAVDGRDSFGAGISAVSQGVVGTLFGSDASRATADAIFGLQEISRGIMEGGEPTRDWKLQAHRMLKNQLSEKALKYLEGEADIPEDFWLELPYAMGYVAGLSVPINWSARATAPVTQMSQRVLRSKPAMKYMDPIVKNLGMTPEVFAGRLVNTTALTTQIYATTSMIDPLNMFEKRNIVTAVAGGVAGAATQQMIISAMKRRGNTYKATRDMLRNMELNDPRRAEFAARLMQTNKKEQFLGGWAAATGLGPAMEATQLMYQDVDFWSSMGDYFDVSNPYGFWWLDMGLGTIDGYEAAKAYGKALSLSHNTIDGGNPEITERAIQLQQQAKEKNEARRHWFRKKSGEDAPQAETETTQEPAEMGTPEWVAQTVEKVRKQDPETWDKVRAAQEAYNSYIEEVGSLKDVEGEAPVETPTTFGDHFKNKTPNERGRYVVDDITGLFPDMTPWQQSFYNQFIKQDPVQVELTKENRAWYVEDDATGERFVRMPETQPFHSKVFVHEGIGHQFTVDLLRKHSTDPKVKDLIEGINDITQSNEWLEVLSRMEPEERKRVVSDPFETAAVVIEHLDEFKTSNALLAKIGFATPPVPNTMERILKDQEARRAQAEEDADQDPEKRNFGYYKQLPQAENTSEVVGAMYGAGIFGESVKNIVDRVKEFHPAWDGMRADEQNQAILEFVRLLEPQDLTTYMPERVVRPVDTGENITNMLEDILGVSVDPYMKTADMRSWAEWYNEQIQRSPAPQDRKDIAEEVLNRIRFRLDNYVQKTVWDITPDGEPYIRQFEGVGNNRLEIEGFPQINPFPYLKSNNNPILEGFKDIGIMSPDLKDDFDKMVAEDGFEAAARQAMVYGFIPLGPAGHVLNFNPEIVAGNRAKALKVIYQGYEPLIVDRLTNPESYTAGVPANAETIAQMLDWSKIPMDGPVTIDMLNEASRGRSIGQLKTMAELIRENKAFGADIRKVIEAYRNMFKDENGQGYIPPYVRLKQKGDEAFERLRAAKNTAEQAKAMDDWANIRDTEIWRASVDLYNRILSNNVPSTKKHPVKYASNVLSSQGKMPFKPQNIDQLGESYNMPKFYQKDGKIDPHYMAAGFNEDGTINVMTLPGFMNESFGLPNPETYVPDHNDSFTYLNPLMGATMEASMGFRPVGGAIKMTGIYETGLHKTIASPSEGIFNTLPDTFPPVGMIRAETAHKNPRVRTVTSRMSPGTRYVMKGGTPIAEITDAGYKKLSDEDAMSIVMKEPTLMIERVKPDQINLDYIDKPDRLGTVETGNAAGHSLPFDPSTPEMNKYLTQVQRANAYELTEDIIGMSALTDVAHGKRRFTPKQNEALRGFLRRLTNRLHMLKQQDQTYKGISGNQLSELATHLEAATISENVNRPLLKAILLTYPQIIDAANHSLADSYDNIYQVRNRGASVTVGDMNVVDIEVSRENAIEYLQKTFSETPRKAERAIQRYKQAMEELKIFDEQGFIDKDSDLGVIVPEAWLEAMNERRGRQGEAPLVPGTRIILQRTPIDAPESMAAGIIAGVHPRASHAVMPPGFMKRSGTDMDADRIGIIAPYRLGPGNQFYDDTQYRPVLEPGNDFFVNAWQEMADRSYGEGTEALDILNIKSPSGKPMPVKYAPLHTTDALYPDFMYGIGQEKEIGKSVGMFRQVMDQFLSKGALPGEEISIGKWSFTNNPNVSEVGRVKIEAYDSFGKSHRRVDPELAFANIFDLKWNGQYIVDLPEASAKEMVGKFKEMLQERALPKKRSRGPQDQSLYDELGSLTNPSKAAIPYSPSFAARKAVADAEKHLGTSRLPYGMPDKFAIQQELEKVYQKIYTDPDKVTEPVVKKVNLIEAITKKSSIDNPYTDSRNYYAKRPQTMSEDDARAMVAVVNYSLNTLPIVVDDGVTFALPPNMGTIMVNNGSLYWMTPEFDMVPLTKVFQPNGQLHERFDNIRMQNALTINEVVPRALTGYVTIEEGLRNLNDVKRHELDKFLEWEQREENRVRITFSALPKERTLGGRRQVVMTVNPEMTEPEFRAELMSGLKQLNKMLKEVGPWAHGAIVPESFSHLTSWQEEIVRNKWSEMANYGTVFQNDRGITDQEASELAGRLAVTLGSSPEEMTDLALLVDNERFMTPFGIVNGALQAGAMPEVEIYGERMSLPAAILRVAEKQFGEERKYGYWDTTESDGKRRITMSELEFYSLTKLTDAVPPTDWSEESLVSSFKVLNGMGYDELKIFGIDKPWNIFDVLSRHMDPEELVDMDRKQTVIREAPEDKTLRVTHKELMILRENKKYDRGRHGFYEFFKDLEERGYEVLVSISAPGIGNTWVVKDEIAQRKAEYDEWRKAKDDADAEGNQRSYGYYKPANRQSSLVEKVIGATRGISPSLSAKQRRQIKSRINDARSQVRAIDELSPRQIHDFMRKVGDDVKQFGLEGVDDLIEFYDAHIPSEWLKEQVEIAEYVHRDDPKKAKEAVDIIKMAAVLDYLDSLKRMVQSDRDLRFSEVTPLLNMKERIAKHRRIGGVGSFYQDAALGIINRMATDVVPMSPDEEITQVISTQNGVPVNVVKQSANTWVDPDTGWNFRGGAISSFIPHYGVPYINHRTTNEQHINIVNKISSYASSLWRRNDEPKVWQRLKTAFTGKPEEMSSAVMDLFAQPEGMGMARRFFEDPSSLGLGILTQTEDETVDPVIPMEAPEFEDVTVSYDGVGNSPSIRFSVTADSYMQAPTPDQESTFGRTTREFVLQSFERADMENVLDELARFLVPDEAVMADENPGTAAIKKKNLRKVIKQAAASWIGTKVNAEFMSHHAHLAGDLGTRAMQRTHDGLEAGPEVEAIAATMDKETKAIYEEENLLRNATILDAIDLSSALHPMQVADLYRDFVADFTSDQPSALALNNFDLIAEELFPGVSPALARQRVVEYMSDRADEIYNHDKNFPRMQKFIDNSLEVDDATERIEDTQTADLYDVRIARILGAEFYSPAGLHKRLKGSQQRSHRSYLNVARTSFELEQEYNQRMGLPFNQNELVSREQVALLSGGRIPTINNVPRANIMAPLNAKGVATSRDTGIPVGTPTTLAIQSEAGDMKWLQGRWLGAAGHIKYSREGFALMMEPSTRQIFEVPMEMVTAIEIGHKAGFANRIADHFMKDVVKKWGTEEQMLTALLDGDKKKTADGWYSKYPEFFDAPMMHMTTMFAENINKVSTGMSYLFGNDVASAATHAGIALVMLPFSLPASVHHGLSALNHVAKMHWRYLNRITQNLTTGANAWISDPFISFMHDVIPNIVPSQEGLQTSQMASAAQRFAGHYGAAINEASGDVSTHETSTVLATVKRVQRQLDQLRGTSKFEDVLALIGNIEMGRKELELYDDEGLRLARVYDENGNMIGGLQDIYETNVDAITQLFSISYGADNARNLWLRRSAQAASIFPKSVNNYRLQMAYKQAETEQGSVKSVLGMHERSEAKQDIAFPIRAAGKGLFSDDVVKRANIAEDYMYSIMGQYIGKSEALKAPLAHRAVLFSHFGRGRAKMKTVRAFDYLRQSKALGRKWHQRFLDMGIEVGTDGVLNPVQIKTLMASGALGGIKSFRTLLMYGFGMIISDFVADLYGEDSEELENMKTAVKNMRSVAYSIGGVERQYQMDDILATLVEGVISLITFGLYDVDDIDKGSEFRFYQVKGIDQTVQDLSYGLSGGMGVSEGLSVILSPFTYRILEGADDYDKPNSNWETPYNDKVDEYVTKKVGRLPFIGPVAEPIVEEVLKSGD